MSKRHILEDSDSDDDGAPPALKSFFTPEEEQAIERCNIQTGKNQGRYSEDDLFLAISKLGEPPLERAKEGEHVPQFYQKYRVKKGEERSFFEMDIYRVHGTGGEECDVSPSEETILLHIEAIQRSEKAVFNRMFKNKDMGGQVVFGAWWNYALQRILQLSSEGVKDESLQNYTAVKIMRSLFAFIVNDQLIKSGKALQKLNTDYGIDWMKNVEAARKVINHCGPSHFLDKELKAVEAHLEGVKSKGKAKPATATGTKTASNEASAETSAKQAQANEEELKKKAEAARKKRIQQMRASNLRRFTPAVESVAKAATPAPPQKATAPHPARESHAQGREAAGSPGARSRFDAPKQQVQKPSPAGDDNGRSRPSGKPVVKNDINERKSPARPTLGGGQSNANVSSPPARGRTSTATSDDGWGRKRGEDSSARPFKTKGSWVFARRALSCDILVDSTKQEPSRAERSAPPEMDSRAERSAPPEMDSRVERSAPPEMDSRAERSVTSEIMDTGASIRAWAALSSLSSRNDRSRGRDDYGRGGDEFGRGGDEFGRGPRRGREYENRDRYNSSRSDDYSSRRGDSRFDSRSSDRGRDGGRSFDREDYPRGSSRSGDYGRENYRGDDSRRPRGSQDRGSRDYGGSGYGQESRSRSQDSDGEVRPQKRFRAPAEAAAPIAPPAGTAGRGRGAHVNTPAWMSRQGQNATSQGPTGVISGNDMSSAINPGTAASAGGAGRGRGAHKTKPAWMAKQERASSNGTAGVGHQAPAPVLNQHAHGTHPSGPVMPTNNNSSANPSVAVAAGGGGGGAGRGRGAHRNRPAWLAEQERASSNGQAGMGHQAPVPQQAPQGMDHNAHASSAMNALNAQGPSGGVSSNGQGRGRGPRGRGRGRGRDKNLPAWITNPKPNP